MHGVSTSTSSFFFSFLLTPQTTQLLYPDTIPSALSRNTSRSVAIIGGGAAGLTAAATLQQLGYKRVVVFESNPEVGGKCLSVEIDGAFYDLGAIQAAGAYKMVPGLAAATKTPFHRFSAVPKSEAVREAAAAALSGLGGGGGNNTGGLSSSLAENAELLAGVAAVAATTKRYFREISSPGMLQASENPSLAGSTFSEFAAANKFGAPMTMR